MTMVTTSSVSQPASIPRNPSTVATSGNSNFPASSISLFTHRLNAGSIVLSSQPDTSRTDRVLSSSVRKTTQASSTRIMTGVNISTHHNIGPSDSEGMLNPRQLGAIIGGSVGVTAGILIAMALFLVLQWRRRRRHVLRWANCEKKAKIGKSRHTSSSGPVRASDVSSGTGCLYNWIPLPPNSLSFSNHFEQSNVYPDTTLAHAGSFKIHTSRHLVKPNLPRQDEVWNPVPSPNIQEFFPRNSRCVTSIGLRDPFLDTPQSLEPESSLRRPIGLSHDFYHHRSIKPHRRSMSVPLMPDNNGSIESTSIPNRYSHLPLNFGFREQGEQANLAMHVHMLPARAPPFPTKHTNSITSQTDNNSASSGSVIILPGRSSASSSGIFAVSASDIYRWRRNRSAQEGVIDIRRSDPFGLEKPGCGLTRSRNSSFEYTDTWSP
ncbi:hypothetical protein ACJ72_04517 [Emergomyces africanus]|uniref:Uncharacterized protein n=1 Tax=Emergomyces africanus TaxID=1955775 RepID=A0A1B7NWK2_9EURO|nr:hypothetical protein ACJ72_04517 [Emergomyces africanus]